MHILSMLLTAYSLASSGGSCMVILWMFNVAIMWHIKNMTYHTQEKYIAYKTCLFLKTKEVRQRA